MQRGGSIYDVSVADVRQAGHVDWPGFSSANSIYMAALDLLKAKLWPRHWFLFTGVGCGVDGRDLSRSEASRGRIGNVWSPSDGRDLHHDQTFIGRRWRQVEERFDRGPIEPRSRRDRTAIAARSNRDCGAIEPRSCSFSGGIASRRPDDNRQSTTTKIRARSRRDRGPIVAGSRRKSCLFSKQNWSSFPADLKPQSHALETASTTLENRPHERVNCPWSSGQFPSLKACIPFFVLQLLIDSWRN